MIIKVWESVGRADPNGPATMDNAWKGGMEHVDGCIFIIQDICKGDIIYIDIEETFSHVTAAEIQLDKRRMPSTT